MAYDNIISAKRLYISEGTRRVEAAKIDAEEYRAVIDEFLEEYFN